MTKGNQLFTSRAAAIALFVSLAPCAAAQTAYVACTWNDNSVHKLDSGLNDLSSFPTGSTLPNGIATDGTLIWTGHFITQEVIAYDMNGVEQFRWPANPGIQGLEYISGAELAIMNAATTAIEFHHPVTGAFVRSIPAFAGTTEGIAWDGQWLWQLENAGIHATDVNTGTVAFTIANAATACSFSGTGITNDGPNQLVLACDSGDWYRVSKVDGSVINSGNNGLSMFGIKSTSGAKTGTPICFGDGTGLGCPCGNTGGPGEGCANGTGGGALLTASGNASVSSDTMSLTCDGVINQPGLFFQGNNEIGGGTGVVFGDGLRCCGANVVRIEVVNPPGTASPATAQMTETATTNGPSGTVNPGDQKCYQYWYRDPSSSPCGFQFNLSNAVRVIWGA